MDAFTKRLTCEGRALALALMLSAGAASAGDAPTPSQAAKFIVTHGAPTPIGQLARWGDGVCPETTGVPADVAGYLNGRIRAVATAVRAPVAKGERCTTNVEIIFTNTPQTVVDTIAKNQGQLLGFYNPGDAKTARAVTRPIQAWYLTATENDRHELALDMPRQVGGNIATAPGSYGHAPGSYLASEASSEAQGGRAQVSGVTGEGCLGGKFSRCMDSVFAHVLIVIDGKALYGRKIGPLIDYVTLLALSAPATFDGCDELPSILDLLSKGCTARVAPEELTAGDLAYLAALYKTQLDTELSFERSDIATLMTRGPPKSP
jgi:hypothetical protein